MVALTILQTTLPTPAHDDFMAFLVGMQDLGFLMPVAIRQPDDSYIALAGSNPTQKYRSTNHLLDEQRIDSFSLYTIGTCDGPHSENWTPLFPRLHQRMTVADVKHSSSLLLFPTVNEDTTPAISFDLLERYHKLDEQISGIFVVSPEESSAPYLPGVPVLDDTLIPHAAASTAVLAGLVDPTVSVIGPTAPKPVIGQLRVVRPYARLVDMDKMTDNLVSAILDVEDVVGFDPDWDRSLVPYPHPDSLVKAATDELVTGHQLAYTRSAGFRPRPERGVIEAIKELVGHIGRLFSRGPASELPDVREGLEGQRTERMVQRILDGHRDPELSTIQFPDSTRDKHPDLLEPQVREARQALIDHGGSAEYLPEDPRVEPDRELFMNLTDRGLKLLDGWIRNNEEVRPVEDQSYVLPPLDLDHDGFLETSTVADNAVNIGYAMPLGWDPSELYKRLLEHKNDSLSAPPVVDVDVDVEINVDVDPTWVDPTMEQEAGPGDEGQTPPAPATTEPPPEHRKEYLDRLAAAGERAYVTRIGRRMFNSRTLACMDFMKILAEMNEDRAAGEGGDRPETRANLQLTVLTIVTTFAGIAVAWGATTDRLTRVQTLSLGIAITLLAGLAFTLIAIGFEAARNRRERLWGPRGARRRQLQDTWHSIHRYGALYREYLDWATTLGGYLLHPVGRSGEIVEYGSQASRPRWLVTAQNVRFSDGYEARQRRSIFARGWRGGCFHNLIDAFAERYRLRKDYDSIDPYDDLYDTRGARRELVGSAIPSAALGIEEAEHRIEYQKRKYFVTETKRRLLSASGEALAEPENVDQVTAGRERHEHLNDFFGVLKPEGERHIFAGFLFPPEGTNIPTSNQKVEESVVSLPKTGMEDSDVQHRVPSSREWPILCSARIDFSPLTDPVTPAPGNRAPTIDLREGSTANIPRLLD